MSDEKVIHDETGDVDAHILLYVCGTRSEMPRASTPTTTRRSAPLRVGPQPSMRQATHFTPRTGIPSQEVASASAVSRRSAREQGCGKLIQEAAKKLVLC